MSQLPVTIDDLIGWGEDQEISHRNLHSKLDITDKKSENTIQVPLNEIMGEYRYFYSPYLIDIAMNDTEMTLYCYKPKSLSQKLYGTTELWSLLLSINNCLSKVDFNKRNIKVLNPKRIKAFINEVLILEKII